ncbi:MAG: hypothetical protein HY898_16765 [Deltaproteobacteria bacterium]|nr:hypothetical protein [Deltaproteobacteria bacterium]
MRSIDRMGACRVLATLAVVAASLGHGAPSLAAGGADSALNKAREQFQRAISLETAGDWTTALSLLREVSNVKMTPQVRYNIALCEEHLGQLVAALGDYELAAADARDAKAQDVSAVVGPRLDSLRERIPKLVILRGRNAAVASISVDGVAIGASMIGKEMPINPGPHTVEAKASGFKPMSLSIDIAEKSKKPVEINLDPIPAAAPSSTPPVAPVTPPAADSGPPPKPYVLPFVVGGVGVASLIASGVFYGLRAGTTSDLDAVCGPSRDACPASAEDTYNKGKTYNTVANVTLAVGAVGIAAGAVLYFTHKKPSSTSQSAFGVAPGGPAATPGATFIGRF